MILSKPPFVPSTPRTAAQAVAHYYTAGTRSPAPQKSLWSLAKTAPHPIRWRLQKKLCAALFHTFDGWKSPQKRRAERQARRKAVIRCKLWKYKDSSCPKTCPLTRPADPGTAEQGGGDYHMDHRFTRTLAG